VPTADCRAEWIKEGMTLTVVKFKGKAIDVQIPGVVTYLVTEAAPGAKGNTAGGRTERPVTVETGATVNVPMFIEQGESIRVDTETGKYLGRAEAD
jgi:elongation factor P